MLYLKPCGEKTQLLIRMETTTGKVLLNINLAEDMPISRSGKNNVMLVSVPNPPVFTKPADGDNSIPCTYLIRVKGTTEADELLSKMKPTWIFFLKISNFFLFNCVVFMLMTELTFLKKYRSCCLTLLPCHFVSWLITFSFQVKKQSHSIFPRNVYSVYRTNALVRPKSPGDEVGPNQEETMSRFCEH